jgi:SAM-dependent methyltransferase
MLENNSATAALYKELPYPGDGVVRTTIARIARRGLQQLAPEFLDRPGLRIIDIGCGTGEITAGVARLFPAAEVVGIDINPASIDLASRLSSQSGLNIRFLQCDLMDDPAMTLRAAGLLTDERKFDLLLSIGVLHHLADPDAGFRNVRSFIGRDGFFLAYMYSKLGRWNDIAAVNILNQAFAPGDFVRRADAVRSLKLSTKHTLGGFLSTLRSRLRYGPPLAPLELMRARLRRRNLVHVSDTFSNPCETYYTFAELQQLAQSTNWIALTLAEQGGLPVTPEEFTHDTEMLGVLNALPRNVLYDYFAYLFRADGFIYWLRPSEA